MQCSCLKKYRAHFFMHRCNWKTAKLCVFSRTMSAHFFPRKVYANLGVFSLCGGKYLWTVKWVGNWPNIITSLLHQMEPYFVISIFFVDCFSKEYPLDTYYILILVHNGPHRHTCCPKADGPQCRPELHTHFVTTKISSRSATPMFNSIHHHFKLKTTRETGISNRGGSRAARAARHYRKMAEFSFLLAILPWLVAAWRLAHANKGNAPSRDKLFIVQNGAQTNLNALITQWKTVCEFIARGREKIALCDQMRYLVACIIYFICLVKMSGRNWLDF